MADRSIRFAVATALALSTGCSVRVYQPLTGLHQPVVVNPQLPNFQDLRLDVRCVPGGMLNAQEAGALCQKVGLLFENQGATVTASAAVGPDDEESADKPATEPAVDLTLRLSARETHKSNDIVSWILCLGTFTVVPAVSESDFAQDVEIRDSTGFLLVSQSLEGRILIRWGSGTWLGNKFLDLTFRKKDDRLTGDAMNKELSTDLYRQLSQLVFNAKMESQVLSQVPARAHR